MVSSTIDNFWGPGKWISHYFVLLCICGFFYWYASQNVDAGAGSHSCKTHRINMEVIAYHFVAFTYVDGDFENEFRLSDLLIHNFSTRTQHTVTISILPSVWNDAIFTHWIVYGPVMNVLIEIDIEWKQLFVCVSNVLLLITAFAWRVCIFWNFVFVCVRVFVPCLFHVGIWLALTVTHQAKITQLFT